MNGRGRRSDRGLDLPQRLKRFRGESRLSWSEIAHRLGTCRHIVWRWADRGVRPHHQHRKALVEPPESLGLGHLFAN